MGEFCQVTTFQSSLSQAACQFILLRMFLQFQRRDGYSPVNLTQIRGSLVPRFFATHLPIINMVVSSACEEAETEVSTLSILARGSLHSVRSSSSSPRKAKSVLSAVTGQKDPMAADLTHLAQDTPSCVLLPL